MHVTKITTQNCEVFGAGGTIPRGQILIALLDKEKRMPDLPPLESVRAFEAAARHESFVPAARELQVTAATVSHRVRALERHIGARLFSRYGRGVRLNARGRAYADEIRRIFAGITAATERHRDRAEAKRLKLVAVEVVAEKWLMPRLADFKAVHPDISIEFETDHREVDPDRRDFDIWIAFTDRVADTLHAETLFEETLLPVCSPAFLKAQGQPREPSDLHGWPLLYDLHWATYWSHWFAHHGLGAADLSQASGFRLYSMMVQAAVEGMGVALGHSLMIARELAQGTLVSLFDSRVTAPARYLLVTTPASIGKPPVRAFRDWVLHQAGGRSRHGEIGVASLVPPAVGAAPDVDPGEQSNAKVTE